MLLAGFIVHYYVIVGCTDPIHLIEIGPDTDFIKKIGYHPDMTNTLHLCRCKILLFHNQLQSVSHSRPPTQVLPPQQLHTTVYLSFSTHSQSVNISNSMQQKPESFSSVRHFLHVLKFEDSSRPLLWNRSEVMTMHYQQVS